MNKNGIIWCIIKSFFSSVWTCDSNDGTVFAHDASSGQQVWNCQTFSLVYVVSHRQWALHCFNCFSKCLCLCNWYHFPRFQRRVAVSEGRSDIQSILMVIQLLQASLWWQQAASHSDWFGFSTCSLEWRCTKRPEVYDNKVFVSSTDWLLMI